MILASTPRSVLSVRLALLIAFMALAAAVVALAVLVDGSALAGATPLACNTPWIPVPGVTV